MPTRFYLPSPGGTVPTITPAFMGATTAQTGAAVSRADMATTRQNTPLATKTATTTATLSSTIRQRTNQMFIGPPMSAQTIDGTFTAVFKCSDVNLHDGENLTPAPATSDILIYVITPANVVRDSVFLFSGTSVYAPTANVYGQGWATTLETRIIPTTGLTSLTVLNGDRLVVEIGKRGDRSDSHNYSFVWGDPTATVDHTLSAGQTMVGVPWIEFSQDLFPVAPAATPATASDACTESLAETALIKPSLGATDTGSTSVVELGSINISGIVSLTAADSEITYITESSQIYVSCFASDLLGFSALDDSTVLKDISSADTSATSISEEVNIAVAAQTVDSGITSIVESTVIPLSIASIDTASTSVTELAEVLIGGGINIASVDAGVTSVIDSGILVSETTSLTPSVSDAAITQVIELTNILIAVTSGDVTAFTLSESIQAVVENASSDTLIIVGTESIVTDKTILASDFGTTSIIEIQNNKVFLQTSELETMAVIEAFAITIEVSSADTGVWITTEYASATPFDALNPDATEYIIIRATELAIVTKDNDYSGPNRRPAIFPPRRVISESSMSRELRRLLGPRR